MWRRGVLTARDRRFITLSCVGAAGAITPIETHVWAALNSDDLTYAEFDEFVLFFGTQLGWPKASVLTMHGMMAAFRLAEERGQPLEQHDFERWVDPVDDDTRRQRGEAAYLDVHGVPSPPAPTAFRGRAYLDFLYGEIWTRDAAPDPARPADRQHLLRRGRRRRRGGEPSTSGAALAMEELTYEELQELVVHYAVYLGWTARAAASTTCSSRRPATRASRRRERRPHAPRRLRRPRQPGRADGPAHRRRRVPDHALGPPRRSRSSPSATPRRRWRRSRPSSGAASDVLGVCVVDDAGVDEVLRGPDGALAAMADGSIVVVHSTVHPDDLRAAAGGLPRTSTCSTRRSAAAAHKAAAGELLVMVGGPAEVVDRCRPVLETFGDPVLHVGPARRRARRPRSSTTRCSPRSWRSPPRSSPSPRPGTSTTQAVATILASGSGRSYAAEVVAGSGFDLDGLAPFAGELLAKDVGILVDRAGLTDTVLLAAADRALARWA